jgi:RNA polymerase sigma-70 factor, ECF subfamily
MDSDEHLILDFQRGSREAFTELFQRYRDPLFGFFRRRLDNPARAEELAQETFLAVLRGAARYEPRALFRAYLYGIALKQLAAERRRKRPQTADPAETDDLPDPSPAGNAEAGLWVRRALERLETNEREMLLLREYEGLSYAEIAALLRVPINTVRSRLFRARLALKDLLAPRRCDPSGAQAKM